MPDPMLYLQTIAAAAGISAMWVLLVFWLRRPATAIGKNLVCISGLASGLALGYFILLGQPPWPPANALNRYLLIVLPAVIGIECVAGLHRMPTWIAWTLRAGLIAVAGRILLHGSIYLDPVRDEWRTGLTAVVVAFSGALLATVWGLMHWLSQRSPGVSLPLAMAESTLCAGLIVMLAGYVTGGAAAFPLVAALCATALTSSLVATSHANQGLLGIGIVGLFSLLFIGRFFGGLSSGSSVAVLLAPLMCWVAEIPGLRHQPQWRREFLRLLLTAIPLVIVLTLAKRDFDRKMASQLADCDRARSQISCGRFAKTAFLQPTTCDFPTRSRFSNGA